MYSSINRILSEIPVFFSSSAGMYVAQSFFHSLIAAVIVDRSIHVWKISNPLVTQRFRYIVIILPFFSFMLFQLINPERGTASFRFEALFDINRWLNLELWGRFPLSLIFIFILIITSLITVFQELVPILGHTVKARKSVAGWERVAEDSPVNEALNRLPYEKPDVFITDDEDFILFSSTGRKAAVYISTGLVEMLSVEELQAALAHEIAHIRRSKRPLLLMLYLFRVLMLFNPVVLVEFRKIVREEEKICDDIAVSSTQRPLALAEALKKLYFTEPNLDPAQLANPAKFRDALEDYSHNILIKRRILRLQKNLEHSPDRRWGAFSATFLMIVLISYFVV